MWLSLAAVQLVVIASDARTIDAGGRPANEERWRSDRLTLWLFFSARRRICHSVDVDLWLAEIGEIICTPHRAPWWSSAKAHWMSGHSSPQESRILIYLAVCVCVCVCVCACAWSFFFNMYYLFAIVLLLLPYFLVLPWRPSFPHTRWITSHTMQADSQVPNVKVLIRAE